MDRLVVTGEEGHGKSTWLRQMNIQCGAGVHPFTLKKMDPLRALLIDVENSREQIKSKAIRLAETAGLELVEGQSFFLIEPSGFDLTNLHQQREVEAYVRDVRPELLIAGPLYKLMSGDPTKEEVAKPVAIFFDHLRAEYGLTLILEAHSPYAQNGASRPLRPYGWSGWSRWPEFGIHISQVGKLSHWRGPREEGRGWPTSMQRGEPWPWMLGEDDRQATIWKECVAVAGLWGYQPAVRELEEKLGYSKSAIGRVLKAHKVEWDTLKFED